MAYSGTLEEQRAKQREAQRRYRERHRKPRSPDHDWAPGEPKYKTETERRVANVATTLRARSRNKESYNAYMRGFMRKKYPEMRDRVFEKLGGRCAKCGYGADSRALQIDHIDGQGRKERRRIGWYRYYNQILEDSTNYQLLCATCNWIKRYDNEEVYLVDERLKSPQPNGAVIASALGDEAQTTNKE